MRRPLLLAAAVLIALSGCISQDNLFLVQKLDDEAKAKALTEQGIEAYNLLLVRRGDYGKAAEVRDYFTVALRWDPENDLAAQYLDMVDNFKAAKTREKLKEAARLYSKQKRKEEEDFSLQVDLRTASRLDPQNKDVVKMSRDTASIRVGLVETYLSRSKSAVAKIDKGAPAVTREAAYVEAFQNASRAAAVDPDNGEARARTDALRGELARIFAVHADSARTLTGSGKYEQARAEVTVMVDLNRKLDGKFDAEVRSASYTLNYRWASALFAQKDYPRAAARVDAALGTSRTPEASALKRKVSEARGEKDREVSFEAGLQDIDRLIAKQDPVGAKRRIDALARLTTEQEKLDTLDNRRDAVHGLLKDIYDKGVAAYRDEKFKDAIGFLQAVVQVDVDYEQASDYLEKAKAKQKLLDQF
jgi:hypothetical protein